VRTIVKGKNFEVPERDRRYAERKLQRLERLLDDRSDAIVELSVERHRNAADSHIVDLTLIVDGQTIRGKAAATTHRAGVDEVMDKVERRAVDAREKARSRRPEEHAAAGSAATRPRTAPRAEDADADEDADGSEDEAPRVTKVKRFAIEPMFEEDAVARMEELGHAFFVFVDAETERIAVLYRRRDGHYGIIEPLIAGGYTSERPGGGTARR
jgi:putative sigma-54 modulation protein